MKKTVLTLLLLATAFVCSEAKTRKTLFVIVDGIPADCIERLKPHTIMDIAEEGGYARAYCGGDVGMYSETPTISAIGYSNIITGTWMNKHNVRGNSNIQENYNYPTIFRIAKNQSRPVTTAIYSSWTDNRTVLLGEGKPETGNLKIDYVFDGYDNDKTNFPNKPGDFHIFDIDAHVCAEAAKNIRTNAPDLNWVYLWYTDDAFHIKGNGEHSDWSVTATDSLLRDLWEAVKYREKNNDEEWLVIIVTDHGRGNDGHNHGGQSARERTVWMATNLKKRNAQFGRPTLSHTDILPTICEFMDFDVPDDVLYELDGTSFYGKNDIYDLQAAQYDDKAILSWKCDNLKAAAWIYMATTNNKATGGKDNWQKVGEVPAPAGSCIIDLKKYGDSKFYKFAVRTMNNCITRQLHK